MKQYNLFTKRFHKEHSRKEWINAFVEHCNKKCSKYGDSCGVFMCGFYWCCDKCKFEIQCGCSDCVKTIVEILENNNVSIDYNDFDFDKWEEKAMKLEGTK